MSYERRKVRVGRVVSDKMDKTVVVVYEWSRPHPIYKKAVRRQTRFNAHDPENQCQLGDMVRIVESRPTSKTKRWKVAEILSSKEIAELQPEEIQVDESVASAAATSALNAEAAEPASPAPEDEETDGQ
ncbi:MAG: 30S ribosomal protein S17 [SAR202 cluster bacterium]|jgi:small subunit ribosomal protein S17|nr:30S ribosomal protein S17 [Chloroflexota bacterium]MQG56981.1 30S ribosomal protein S17 [SAR202 cluster bacterium]MQG68288.1 30S ribosomal protein S17 [SAR202 cluster bacterium]HAL48632.1 30S ribosomal protein S17 [Dehalococcoidia bacterium]|tara:strand:- start:17155 stop:17541 length:387 start_codon:yes stop_codon:yes gene_type:complete